MQNGLDFAERILQEAIHAIGPKTLYDTPQKQLGPIECCRIPAQCRGSCVEACLPGRKSAALASRILADKGCKATLHPLCHRPQGKCHWCDYCTRRSISLQAQILAYSDNSPQHNLLSHVDFTQTMRQCFKPTNIR